MDSDNSKKANTNKIVWKRATSDDTSTSTSKSRAAHDDELNSSLAASEEFLPETYYEEEAPAFSPLDTSARAAHHKASKESAGPALGQDAVNDLKNEIESAFSSHGDEALSGDSKESESIPPFRELEEDFDPHQNTPLSPVDEVTRDNHETLMASLKQDIQHKFEGQAASEEKPSPQSVGVGKTYYSDLTRAMSSNEPATMSELIQKSRFEEKERAILSPRSRKNMLYIIGGIILLAASLGILFAIFGGKQKVEFITKERVDSLIYSNLDTGINVTGLKPERLKQAIREVVKMKIPEDSLNQVYYIRQDGAGGISRLGIKEVFRLTENTPPDLLYNNIENNFMHGIYKSDKNYPFIILKATSYDRAFEGMKEWETTMIDDLSTYFNLPPEAGDRSLMAEGFEDDLIKNKNVRVARYLPRDVDRKGILDFLKFGGSKETQNDPSPSVETEPTQGAPLGENVDPKIGQQSLRVLAEMSAWFGRNAFAQQPNNSPFTTQGASPSNTTRQCYNNEFPGQVFAPSLEGQAGYYCVDVMGQGTAISQITRTAPVCFDPVHGTRLTEEQQSTIGGGGPENPYGFCFVSYQCKETACFIDKKEVDASRLGEPGVFCGIETTRVVDIDSDVPKICRQFNDLLRMDNLNSGLLCFNPQGQYLPNYTQSNSSQGVTCIGPLSRGARMCIEKQSYRVFNPEAPNAPPIESAVFCFEPLKGKMEDLDVNKKCANLTTLEIQQRLAQIGYELHLFANIAQIIGIGSNDVQNIREVASLLMEMSRKNVLQVEEVRRVAAMIQRLERVLNSMDPNLELPMVGPNGGMNVYGFLRNLIEMVKCTLGIANTLQWITLEQIPQGMMIYSGQTLPQMIPIQQSLVLLGLMDPLSVTGTLDLVTQDAISQLQLANGIEVTGIIDSETAILINTIIENNAALFPDGILESNEAIINDYFLSSNAPLDQNGNPIGIGGGLGGILGQGGTVAGGGTLGAGGSGSTTGAAATQALLATGMGTYSNAVQNLQMILYGEGYDIPTINGLFDQSTCDAVRSYQEDNGLEQSDPITCTVGDETFNSLNELIRENGYLGSGFKENPQGYLEGVGKLKDTFGPGAVNYLANPASADTLEEGDIVLLYTFLDEETILIARDEIVIEEVIKRRSLHDIFFQ